jgi:hypothetical protein
MREDLAQFPYATETPNAKIIAASIAMYEALKKLHEYRNIILARSGAAGHRQTATGEWVCDPWTQAFKDAGEALAQAEGKKDASILG